MALLTTAEIRTYISTSLADAALQVLLDATEQDIIAAAGTTTDQTEYADGGYAKLVLTRPIGEVDSVTEYADTASESVLAADDYRIDGHILHRLTTGTNPAYYWHGPVKVVHDPSDRLAERKRAQVALVQLELAYASGITSERIGDYSVGYGNAAGGTDYQEAKELVLRSLRPVLVR